MLDFVPPLSPVDRNERSRPYTWAEIVLEFDVSAAGLPSDVRVVTRDASTSSLQTRYSRRMRETHFRPRLVDGRARRNDERALHTLRSPLREQGRGRTSRIARGAALSARQTPTSLTA